MNLRDVASKAQEEFNSIVHNPDKVSGYKFELVLNESEHVLKISVFRLCNNERILFWRNRICSRNNNDQIGSVISSMKFALGTQYKRAKAPSMES